MTLQQLNHFKHWHVCHRQRHELEFALCDLVLGAWLFGWMLLPTLVVLDAELVMPVSLALVLLPDIYCGLRKHLHHAGLLRCDWLDAVRLR
ncbi:MAG: hypothetical protein RLZZ584_1776 [Pseudomonadota bacterium]|jgi:hypothetical protein